MLLLLIPVLMIIWGFWWIRKPPAYPKNLGNFFIGYRTQWALKSPDTWLYSHVRYGRWMIGLGLVSLVLTVVFVFVLPANIVERAILAMDVIMLIIPYIPIEKDLRYYYDKNGHRRENL